MSSSTTTGLHHPTLPLASCWWGDKCPARGKGLHILGLDHHQPKWVLLINPELTPEAFLWDAGRGPKNTPEYPPEGSSEFHKSKSCTVLSPTLDSSKRLSYPYTKSKTKTLISFLEIRSASCENKIYYWPKGRRRKSSLIWSLRKESWGARPTAASLGSPINSDNGPIVLPA